MCRHNELDFAVDRLQMLRTLSTCELICILPFVVYHFTIYMHSFEMIVSEYQQCIFSKN